MGTDYKEYDYGFKDGFMSGIVATKADYQQGQVAMRTKVFAVIRKWYGDSVYNQLMEKINEIPLEK